MRDEGYSYRLFAREDFSAFWALFTDNLVNLIVLAGICQFVFGMPAEIVFGRIVPRAAVAIVGSFVIAFQPGSDLLRFGSALILVATLMYASHTAIVKRFSAQIDFVNFFFFRLFATTAVLLVVAAGRGVLVWPHAGAWPIVVLTALVDIIISRVLFYVALRRLQMSMHTIFLTLGPVLTVLWSIPLFGVAPGPQQLVGGLAVLAGVMLVSWPRR